MPCGTAQGLWELLRFLGQDYCLQPEVDSHIIKLEKLVKNLQDQSNLGVLRNSLYVSVACSE